MKTDTFGDESQRTYKYEAFISYRHVEPDASIAIALHRALEHFTIPPMLRKEGEAKRIGRIFRDQDELPTSPNLGRDIEEALHDSKWLIIVCSPRFLESQWCMREVDSFIEQGRRDSILTLLVEGEPSESFPPQIRFVNIDGETVELEPLAADVRAQTVKGMKKKLKREKLRLLAPMLGVTFDTLFQRAKKYARKKTAAVLSGIAAALLVFGGIIGFQAMQTAQANKIAAMEQIAKLIATSESYITDRQQSPAVNAARKAFELAREHGIYEQETEAALYRTIVQFPANGLFAKLKHNSDILQTVFSPDGSRIAMWTQDNLITVWDTRYAVKCCEIDLAPNLFSLQDLPFYIDDVETNWCSFCFNADNELFVMDLSNLKLSKYSVDGTLLCEAMEDFGRGINYVELTSGDNISPLYRPHIQYLRSADAIVLSSYVTTDPESAFFSNYASTYPDTVISLDGVAFDAALFAYDAKTGEKIYEQRFETDSHHPVGMQVAGDEESIVCYYTEVEKGLKALLLNEDVLRNSALLTTYDLSQETGKYFRQLYDGIFLTATNEKELAVLDAETMTYYPLPGVTPPKESDTNHYMLPGQKRGEFYAGFQTTGVNFYSFDGSAVSLVRTEIDIARDTVMGEWIARFGWANKDEGTVTYACDMIGEDCRRIVLGNQLYYHDYMYEPLLDDYVFSDYGYYAETEDNLCTLYNLSKSNNEFSREALPARNQPGLSHVDMEQELIVTQNSDEEGFYFEISTFDDAHPTVLHKVYLPNTKGYNVKEDETPYEEVVYAKDYAVIEVPLQGNEAEENEGYSILYILHYRSGTLRASSPLRYPTITAVNEMGVIMEGFFHVRIVDSDDPTNVTEIESGALVSEEWKEAKTRYGWSSGPAARNILLSPFFEKTRSSQLMLGCIDLDKQQFVESDTRYLNDVNYPVLWSDSGNIFFALDGRTNFNAYNIDNMTMLKREDFPADIVAMKKIGGNIIALYSSQNAVEFYDMDSCKKLFAIEPSVDAPQHISYNETNGLAVVSRETGFEIIDIKGGSYLYGPVFFDRRNVLDNTLEIYISNNKTALLWCTSSSRESDNGITYYWYNYSLQDLPDSETLLEAAKKFS